VTDHIPFGSNISCMHSYSSVSISTRNWVPSFTNYKDMIGAKLKNGSRDSDHAYFRVHLSPQARIWCCLHLHVKFDDSSFSRFLLHWTSKFKVSHAHKNCLGTICCRGEMRCSLRIIPYRLCFVLPCVGVVSKFGLMAAALQKESTFSLHSAFLCILATTAALLVFH